MLPPSPPKKFKCHITPPSPHNGQLSTPATFLCTQGGRCGDIRLYYVWQCGLSCYQIIV